MLYTAQYLECLEEMIMIVLHVVHLYYKLSDFICLKLIGQALGTVMICS